MLADGIVIYADCSSGVKNYYACDWCFVTESQMLCGLFYLLWFMMLQDQCLCDRWCVTRAKMLCGCCFCVLVNSSATHTICVKDGICQCFY